MFQPARKESDIDVRRDGSWIKLFLNWDTSALDFLFRIVKSGNILFVASFLVLMLIIFSSMMAYRDIGDDVGGGPRFVEDGIDAEVSSRKREKRIINRETATPGLE